MSEHRCDYCNDGCEKCRPISQMSQSKRDCKHNVLARSCDLCALEKENEELLNALESAKAFIERASYNEKDRQQAIKVLTEIYKVVFPKQNSGE